MNSVKSIYPNNRLFNLPPSKGIRVNSLLLGKRDFFNGQTLLSNSCLTHQGFKTLIWPRPPILNYNIKSFAQSTQIPALKTTLNQTTELLTHPPIGEFLLTAVTTKLIFTWTRCHLRGFFWVGGQENNLKKVNTNYQVN